MSAAPALLTPGWPRVTEVLRDAGLVSTEWFTEEARDRGTAVHAACHYLLDGDLDRGSLDPTVAPRLAQFERFLADAQPKIHASELEVWHEVYRYLGHLDIDLTLNGRRGVLDIKGPTESDWHGVQLAAYAATYAVPMARWSLYLTDDRYVLKERRNREDWNCFKAALTLVNWRKSCRRS